MKRFEYTWKYKEIRWIAMERGGSDHTRWDPGSASQNHEGRKCDGGKWHQKEKSAHDIAMGWGCEGRKNVMGKCDGGKDCMVGPSWIAKSQIEKVRWDKCDWRKVRWGKCDGRKVRWRDPSHRKYLRLQIFAMDWSNTKNGNAIYDLRYKRRVNI